MKIGIVGTGNVGCACAMAAAMRGSAREIVLVNRTRKTAEAVATDIRYGIPVGRKVDIRDGDYRDLAGAEVVDHLRRKRKDRRRHRPQRSTGTSSIAGQERRDLSRYHSEDR